MLMSSAHLSFLSDSDEEKKNSYQSWREEWEADMSTGCSRTLASTWQGERSATESRGRHTGVGEHSAPRLMAPWCLWDKTEVSRTHCAVQGLLKMCQQSLYLTFPLLLMHYITEMDVVASTRSDLIGCLSKFFFFALFQDLKHKTVMTVSHFAKSAVEQAPTVNQVGLLNQH